MIVEMINHQIDLIIWLAILIMSSAFHETAHAWVAYKCGDDTAKEQGRITLNPIKHICMFNSILLPAILYLSAGFMFGGAKPVPIYPHKLRNPDRDMALSAAAGPISNLMIVVGCVIFLLITKPVFDRTNLLVAVAVNVIILNLLLAFFNMIPIPPLDGSRVIRFFFPPLRELFDTLDNIGLFLIFGLIYLVPGVGRLIFELIVSSLEIINELYKAMPS